MKALDTNALIRFLVRDDEKQAQMVRRVLLDAQTKGDSFFISHLVILESIWVLSSVYKKSRTDILQALDHLLVLSVFEIEEHDQIASLCRIAKDTEVDLADLLIGIRARDYGCQTTLTFDRKASKSDLFTILS